MKDSYVRTVKYNLVYIKEMLYDVFEEYNDIKEQKRILKDRLFELENEYSNIKSNKKGKSKLCSSIETDIDTVRTSINELEYNISPETKMKYIYIMSALKNDKVITVEQYGDLIKLFKQKNLDEFAIVKLLESLRIHNVIANCKKQDIAIDYDRLYETMDILNSGYEVIDIDEDHYYYDETIALLNAKRIIRSYRNKNLDDAYNRLNPSQYIDRNEYIYILQNCLNYIKGDMQSFVKRLSVIENYNTKTLRAYLIEQYKYSLDFYLKVRELLDNEIDFDEDRDYGSNTKRMF